MIKFYADGLLDALGDIRSAKEQARSISKATSGIEATDNQKKTAERALEKLRPLCDSAELKTTVDRIIRCYHKLAGLSDAQGCSNEVLETELQHIEDSVSWELQEHQFAFIPTNKAKHFEQEKLFGDAVYVQFEEARQDLKSAGNCLASDLNTAAVFHLMRVVEFGMRQLTKQINPKIKTPLAYCDWKGLIVPMEQKLKAAEQRSRGPKKSKQLDFYSRCLSDCKALIDTRNRVSHAREPFSDTEQVSSELSLSKRPPIKLGKRNARKSD